MALVPSLDEFCGCAFCGGSLGACMLGGCVTCASAPPQQQRLPAMTITIRRLRLMSKLLTLERYHSHATPSCDSSFVSRPATAFPGPVSAAPCQRPRRECCRRQADPSCRGYGPTPSRD